MKKITIILSIYLLLSIILFSFDKKEPTHIVFDVAVPVEYNEEGVDTPYEDIAANMYWRAIPTSDYHCRQVIYTPETITGIELSIVVPGPTSQEYVINFYNISYELEHSQTFSGDIISSHGMTRIVFEDFVLEEGRQYHMEIIALDNSAPSMIGMVPYVSEWAGPFFEYNIPDENDILCYNLIYDYHGFGFVFWIGLTVLCVFTLGILLSKLKKEAKVSTKTFIIAALSTIILITLLSVLYTVWVI